MVVFINVYAHPGRTDEYGGHYNHSTGEYHYHHGESAHQHPNGVCPYDDSYSNYAIIEKEYDYEEEEDYDYSIKTLEEYYEEKGMKKSSQEIDETEEINMFAWIYASIGLAITFISVLSVLKDFIKIAFKERKSFLGLLFIILIVSAMAIFSYWVLYAIAFRISKSLFEDDVIVTHICANIPTFFIIYYVVKGQEKREQS